MEQTFKILRSFLVVLVVAVVAVPNVSAAETVLIMAEEDGCIWCEQWNADVGGEYPITAEGKAAPLQRIDIHGNLPADMTFKSRLTYTPTFVLMRDGLELSRLEGYPGEDFFWPLLQQMLNEAGIEWQEGQG